MKHLVKTAVIVWFAACALGMAGLWRYQATPGVSQAAPAHWPAGAQTPLAGQGATLVMFAHPHCPCTRASVDELAWVMARCRGHVTAHVLFLHPEDAPPGWTRTSLWKSAAAIPGVDVRTDDGGAEARRFDAEISGQVMLFDAQGRLLFSGGITPGRGHAGENAGREAVVQLACGGNAPQTRTPAFGCLLFNPAPPPAPGRQDLGD